MRKLIAASTLCLCALFLFQATAHAQQIDVAYGGGTISAPSASSASSGHQTQSLAGGYYSTISGDFIFYHSLGLGAEVSWRGSRNYYQPSLYFNSLPYRPVFFDFDAVYAPSLPFHKIQPQLEAGIGVESIRFYCASCGNYYGGTNYTSSKHFMGHLGFGLKFYLMGNFFVRPEVGIYLVHNNYEFSALHATRYGIAIGYTLGSH